MQAPVDEDVHPVVRAIEEMGVFLKSAIEAPGLLNFFPDSGTIGFREIVIHGHDVQLAVVGPDTDVEAGRRGWEARPSRSAPRAGALALLRPIAAPPPSSPTIGSGARWP